MPDFTNKQIILDEKYEYMDSVDAMIGMGAFGAVFKGSLKDSSNSVKNVISRLLYEEYYFRLP